MLDRQRLRADVVARLIAAGTDAGDRVFRSRPTDFAAEECPAISVYTLNDGGDQKGDGRLPVFDADVSLQIDIWVLAARDWDDKLDAICEQVEAALLQSPEFLAEYENVSSYRTKIAIPQGGETRMACASIAIGLQYTNVIEPAIPDAFTGLKITVDAIDPHDNNLNDTGPDGVAEAILELELEQ